ncbi:Response regulator [Treponema sp. JC4]|uniref:HD domain-containing phosphohydrolase n=1 Tax=Treponema sp. JC4 TaxID=1124982 RepID=UPI00025B050F|nr:HD domain-containing phosphohydrolase [Treponema sp. JC4]EID85343.1 Response regulator [Treponema sp. JC4]
MATSPKKVKSRLEQIVEIARSLSEIQDIDILLERILTETRRIVNADAGSIYVVEGTNLKIKYGQNDTQLKLLAPGEKLPYTYFSFPINETSISGYVAKTQRPLNIEDAYSIPADAPYHFNNDTDVKTNYRTRSVYTFPLKIKGGSLLGVIQIINAKDEEGNIISFSDEAELLISHFATSAVQVLQRAYLTSSMVKRMLKMAEFRDPKETYPHVERVSSFSLEIYDRYAFNHGIPYDEQEKYRDLLKIGAKFHDVGKVGISDIILKKVYPRFTEEERNIMKGHTCIGAQLFDPAESDLDIICRDIALHHHDRWDGGDSGYPGKINLNDFSIKDGLLPKSEVLQGSEIPLAARIVAVADVFDALSHKRCYKDSWSVEDSFNEIYNSAGSHFDPEVVEAFSQIKDRICSIIDAIPDADD